MIDEASLPHAALVLPLLYFGTGAADAFAFTMLGGIFTANMTGNAILATIFTRPDYAGTLAGALVAIVAFAAALYVGFRATRARSARHAMLVALAMSAACLKLVVLLWWFAPKSPAALLCAIAASAAAMALQTVAARNDGVPHGPSTTYVTGALTDLIADIARGETPWLTPRWVALSALPLGALSATLVGLHWPQVEPLIPLCATLICIVAVEFRCSRGATPLHRKEQLDGS